MAINTNGSDIKSKRRVKLTADAGFYADADLTEKYGTLDKGTERVFMGPANGSNAHAILVNTSKPYTDGQQRPTIVYVSRDKCGDPYGVAPEPDDDVQKAIDARDAEWRAWIESKSADAPDKA